jgi:ABC-type multidrug transport system ATPase subunit
MSAPPPLTAQRLTVQRGRVPLISDLNFDLAASETIHLRGANGAGKTSLLKVLCGLSAPREGTVRRNSAVAFVPEKIALAPLLKPREWLEMMKRLRGEARIDWRARVAESGLDPGVLEKPSSALSKGMLQRIALIEALASDCGLLFLDEPSSGLDDAGRGWLADAIASRAEQGAAVVLADHLGVAGRELRVSRTLEITAGTGRVSSETSVQPDPGQRIVVVRSRNERGIVSVTEVVERDVDDCLRRLLDAGHHIVGVS